MLENHVRVGPNLALKSQGHEIFKIADLFSLQRFVLGILVWRGVSRLEKRLPASASDNPGHRGGERAWNSNLDNGTRDVYWRKPSQHREEPSGWQDQAG